MPVQPRPHQPHQPQRRNPNASAATSAPPTPAPQPQRPQPELLRLRIEALEVLRAALLQKLEPAVEAADIATLDQEEPAEA